MWDKEAKLKLDVLAVEHYVQPAMHVIRLFFVCEERSYTRWTAEETRTVVSYFQNWITEGGLPGFYF